MEMVIELPGGLRVDATYDGTTIHTDQVKEVGGEGTAPEPFMLFLASIGTCAGIYVLRFCQKRNIPTHGIRIIQRVEFNEKSHMVERIDIDIQVPPEFPAKYQEAVIRTAELCAVKRHLEKPPAIDTHVTFVE